MLDYITRAIIRTINDDESDNEEGFFSCASSSWKQRAQKLL